MLARCRNRRGGLSLHVRKGAMAAEMLNVSRPFLVKLIEIRQIPHHKVGTHRRIRAEDLLAYRQRRDRTRNAALSRLARLKQEGED